MLFITLSTAFLLTVFVYPNLKTILFFLFLILLWQSTFKPLNALYSKFEQLKISGRTSARLKSGVPSWGDSSQSGPAKFQTFKPPQPMDHNFVMGRY